MNFVSKLREPEGVRAGAPSDIQHDRRRPWKPFSKHLFGALELQLERTCRQPLRFRGFFVIGADFRTQFHSRGTHYSANASPLSRSSTWSLIHFSSHHSVGFTGTPCKNKPKCK